MKSPGLIVRTATSLVGVIAGMLLVQMLAFANGDLPGTPTSSQTLQFDSSQFGWHGPMEVGGEYSDKFGLVLHTKYTNSIGPKDALAIAINIGMDEFRSDFTWGHAITPKQWFKITGEHLSQTMNFDFASGQDKNEWMPQEAIGAAYQYLMLHNFIKSAQLSGYYAHSRSRRLDDKTFSSGGVLYNNIRRIAGATSEGLAAGFNFQTIPSNLLSLALNYDNVNFDNKYEPAKNAHGLGVSGSLQQLVTDHLKFNLKGSLRQPYDEYGAGITWLAHTRPGTQLEFGVSGAHSQGKVLTTGKENRVALNVTYHFGGNSEGSPASYGSPTVNLSQNLTSWTAQPAVHMPQVIVMRDQKITKISATDIKPKQNLPLTAADKKTKLVVAAQQQININVPAYFQHADNDIVAYTVTNLPNDLHYDSSKQQITGGFSKQSVGKDYQLELNATATAATLKLPLTISVESSPNCTEIPTQERFIGSPLENDQKIEASQYCTGGSLQYEMVHYTSPATNLSMDKNSGIITGPVQSAGTSHVSFNVTNDLGVAHASFYLDVQSVDSPTPVDGKFTENPINPGGSFSVNAAQGGNFAAHGGYLQYELENPPADLKLSIDKNTGIINGTAPDNTNCYDVLIKAEKYTQNGMPTGLFAQATYSQCINPVPTSTAITENPWLSVSATYSNDVSSHFNNNATRSDYAFNYSLQNSPSWLTINNSGVVSGTVANNAVDSSPTVTAKQTYNNTETGLQAPQQGYSIYIDPTATQPDNLTVDSRANIDYAIAQHFDSHRANGSALTWQFSLGAGSPGFLTINPTTGVITGTAPAVSTDTNYNVTVIATKALADGSISKTVDKSFTLTVDAVPVTLSCPGVHGGTVPNWTVADSGGSEHTFSYNVTLPTNTYYLCGKEPKYNDKCRAPTLTGSDNDRQFSCYYVRGEFTSGAPNPSTTLHGMNFTIDGDTVTYQPTG